MPLLTRQFQTEPRKLLSYRIPVSIYDALVKIALRERVTMGLAISTLLEKALAAERGKPYEPITKPAAPRKGKAGCAS